MKKVTKDVETTDEVLTNKAAEFEPFEASNNGADKVEGTLDDENLDLEPFEISTYGADFPISDIIRRLERKRLIIPDFQRQYVWDKVRASRLIESILLGLPIPNIFLTKEEDQNNDLVIDGLQRLKTIELFHKGTFKDGKDFRLVGVNKKYQGRLFKDLGILEQNKFEDFLIRATYIHQHSPDINSLNAVYFLFERINTGGVKLTPQEIRTSIFRGSFLKLLEELDKTPFWKEVFVKEDNHRRGAELILRFLALGEMPFQAPLKKFLNDYMAHYRKANEKKIEELRGRFERMIDVVERVWRDAELKPFRKPKSDIFNAAIFDSVAVAIEKRLQKGEINDYIQLKEQYYQLLTHYKFNSLISNSTGDTRRTNERLMLAENAFKDVK